MLPPVVVLAILVLWGMANAGEAAAAAAAAKENKEEIITASGRTGRSLQQQQEEETSPSLWVSYVMEPFEDDVMDDLTYYARRSSTSTNTETSTNNTIPSSSTISLNVTTTSSSEQSYVGDQALRVEYAGQVEPTVIVLESHLPSDNSQLYYHNLQGANFLSIWYQYQYIFLDKTTQEEEEASLDIKFFLQQQADTAMWWEYMPSLSLIASTTNNGTTQAEVLDQNKQEGTWKELWISLIPSAWKPSSSSEGEINDNMTTSSSDHLQLDQIRAWRMELHSASAAQGTAQLNLDHMTAMGDGDLLGSILRTPATASPAPAPAIVQEEEAVTDEEVLTTLLQANMQQSYMAPARAYYNLSQARAVALDYVIATDQPSTLRLWLVEENNPHNNNNNNNNNDDDNSFNNNDTSSSSITSSGVVVVERYHSFYELPTIGEGSIAMDLEWDENKGFGNHQLDKDYIKGFQLEWVVTPTPNSSSSSNMEQVLYVRNLRAIDDDEYQQLAQVQQLDTVQCVIQPTELRLIPDLNNFRQFPPDIISNFEDCCLACQEAENKCLYAFYSYDNKNKEEEEGSSCFYTDHIHPESLHLDDGNNNNNNKHNSQFFINNQQRNDYCMVCNCQNDGTSERLVDCKGKGLTILPNQWSNLNWAPRVLDLRQNPDLTILTVSELPLTYLEEIRLPGNLTYLDPAVAHALPQHCDIVYENDQNPNHFLINAISDPSQAFSNVCCGKGDTTTNNELCFCELQSDYPGVDATYEPNVRYNADTYVAEITPSSSFLFEAAYSAEKCAAYCNLDANCGYFTYDNRYQLSEPTCFLMADINGMETIHEEYANENKTQPGYISGQVARTRCEQEDARVIVETTTASKHLIVEELNGFEAQYTVRLGATPLRGAVWIEPKLEPVTALAVMEDATTTTGLHNVDGNHHVSSHHHAERGHIHSQANPSPREGIEISFSPSRIVLYHNETVATVHLVISVDERVVLSLDDTLVITNVVEACDHAFSSSASCITSEELSVFVHVVSEDDTGGSGASIWAPIMAILAVAVVLGACLMLYFLSKSRKRADSFWKVDISELHLGDRPEVLGRGSFGLVLLAEFRGTQVALKKVLKSEKEYAGSAMFSAFFHPSSEHTVPPFESAPADLESGLMALSSRSPALNNSSRASRGSRAYAKKQKDESTLKSFIREMRQLSKLRHPCVTSLMGAVVEKGMVPMIVMEYMDQGSLYDLLHNETVVLESEQLVPILRDITKGMRFLHATDPKVIHGDLKAQNVLVDNKFRAKVADFGLTQKSFMGVTGTPYWLAPEILRSEATNNTTSDVYAFGILLYEVLSRKEPYDGEDFEMVLLDVAHKEKRPPVLTSSAIPIQTMYLECVDENPSERPSFATLDNRMKSIDVLTIETAVQKEDKIAMSITLSDIFPEKIAEALQRGDKVEPQHHDIVTIFFSDIVGFTTISQSLSPLKVSDMLDRLYHIFDALSQKHEVFKVETIGDAWMGVTNLIKEQPDHVKRIARFAIDATKAAAETLIDTEDPDLGFVKIRVGFHSGPVVSNVVGSRNPRFCLFGDTVNTASRMESTSESGKIHCSAISAELLQQQDPELHLLARGRISIKGKGDMFTFFVNEEAPPEEPNSGRKGLSVSFNTRHNNNNMAASTGILDSSFKELLKRQRSVASYRGNIKPRRSKSFETNERGRRFSAYR